MKSRRLIALDIGADCIRMAVFSQNRSGRPELLAHGVEAYATDPAAGMTREALVATALKRLLSAQPHPAARVAIAIDGPSVFSRLVKLPPVPPEKLAQTIRHEAVQNIPFPINDVVWDSYMAAATDNQEPQVLVVAVKRELVDGLVHAVEANGLPVDRVDVAPAALANALCYNYPDMDAPVLLVDVGAQSSNLVFMDGDRIFFRTLAVAGSMLPRLMQEIERSITFHQSQQGGRPPQRLLLSGGVGSPDDFSERLGLPAERFEPLRRIGCVAGISGGEGLGVLVGMAVRYALPRKMEINLVPESLEQKKRSRRRQRWLAACMALVVMILLVWIAGARIMAGIARQEVADAAVRIQALEQIEAQLVPLEARIRELEEQGETYRAVVQKRSAWIEILAELESRLPDGMFLLASEPLRLDDAVGGLRVTVVSYLDKEPAGEDAVIHLRDHLRASRYFSDETSIFKRPTKGLFARQFMLDIILAEPIQ